MTLLEILERPIFNFPLRPDEYFPQYLSEIYDKYLDLLKSVRGEYHDIIEDNLNDVQKNCKFILSITENIFLGKTVDASNQFSNLMADLERYLIKEDKNFQSPIPKHLFKARNTNGQTFGLGDMFHVPFEKRHLIPTSRFSLPGLPCLYLANSIYTCWEELDRPNLLKWPFQDLN